MVLSRVTSELHAVLEADCPNGNSMSATLGCSTVNSAQVTRAPSLSQPLVRCLLLEPGGSRGDGQVRSPFDGLHDTTAPGSRGAADRQQGDAP